MRIPILILCGIFGCALLVAGQPAGQQQRAREATAQRLLLRGAAKDAFDTEMVREKAAKCPDASTFEFNQCYSKEVGLTDLNLRIYEGALRDLMGLGSGPDVAEFNKVEQNWHSYLDAASTAAFHQFGGGTGGPGFEMETHVRLVRGHLRELDTLYGMLLRN